MQIKFVKIIFDVIVNKKYTKAWIWQDKIYLQQLLWLLSEYLQKITEEGGTGDGIYLKKKENILFARTKPIQ